MSAGSTPQGLGMARPTMRDIAERAGTSVMTVSRALNGKPGVSEATCARIRAIAAEIGFRHNDLARSLRGSVRVTTVGLVLEDSATRFYRNLIAGIEVVANTYDALVLTASSGSPDREEASVLALSRSRVDGLFVVLSGVDQSFLLPDQAAGLPLVFVDREPQGIDADTVVADDVGGGWHATRHLLKHGHRQIGVIGGQATADTVVKRIDGHHRALRAGGIGASSEHIVLDCLDAGTAERAVRAMLDTDAAPTALFTLNALCTVGALRAIRGAGLSRQVAVVGFDDFDTADLLEPGVSVIHHDVELLGQRAAEMLFARINGKDAPTRKVELPISLITRGSGELPGPHPPIGVANRHV